MSEEAELEAEAPVPTINCEVHGEQAFVQFVNLQGQVVTTYCWICFGQFPKKMQPIKDLTGQLK